MNFLERLANRRALRNVNVTTRPYYGGAGPASLTGDRATGARSLAAPHDRPAYQLGTGALQWYESPDIMFRQGQGGYALQDPAAAGTMARLDTPIPDWATGSFDDPESFYQWYRASYQHPDFPAEQASLASASAAHREQERGTAAGIAQLEDSQTAIRGLLERFRDDPDRGLIEESLRGYAAPGARMVGETEESAWQQRLAQAAARAEEARRVRAGASGALGGGASEYSRGAYRTLADAQGLQLSAQIAGANEEARRRAVGELGDYTAAGQAFENRLLVELAAIDQEIARIKAGKVVEPTDLMPYSQLAFAREAYDEEQAFRTEALEAYRESAKPGLLDFLDTAMSLVGTGIYEG